MVQLTLNLNIELIVLSETWGMKEWVENWKKTGPALQAQRDEDIRNSDTAKSIAQLDWSFRYVQKNIQLLTLQEW